MKIKTDYAYLAVEEQHAGLTYIGKMWLSYAIILTIVVANTVLAILEQSK